MDTDVLVVGAGPTGLMLANQLVRQGTRVSIIDRHAGPARETRALGVQARTLEIYAHLGIVDQALELGRRATGVNMWSSGRRAARIPFADIGQGLSPYPFVLILGQDDNERLLGEALRNSGVEVQWNTELVGLTQTEDRVIAQVRQPDGTVRAVSAAWVGGCDGARSSVRELSGIPFVGAPYEHVFFVADTQVTGSMVPGEINVYVWRQGFHLFFPMRGADHWRVVGILPPELRGRDDLKFDDVIPSLRQEAGAGLSFQNCSWFSTYHIHHRRAERFRDRRCFLLGDAAHIHSPVGAQGMNTGLQDAYNLGWKLALVAAGAATPALLDSYESERIPVAERLLSTTDAAFSVIVSDGWRGALFRTRIMPKAAALAMRLAAVRRFAFRTIAQIGIRYRRSQLSETLPGMPDDAPRAGDRFPWLRLELSANGATQDLFQALDDTQFTLLVFGQPLPPNGLARLSDRLRVYAVPSNSANDRELARAHIPRPSFYLLRPDGYIGLCGTHLEPAALTRYIVERLRVGHRQPAGIA
ncbi:MAG TPA: FAD-dependent monooxygenase [Gemmatimonadales bacterium]|nr:FAD-dependent monooxygenase [Gemmatimonadales bacterium]